MAEVSGQATVGQASGRGQVVAWGLWDWGSAAFNAVILTFVFSVYLTDKVGENLPGDISASAWLGWALGAAGLVVALTAPVSGQWFDATAKRKLSLAILTGLTVLSMSLMFFVRDDYHYLWLGLVLLAFGSAFFELANVPYNAMLRQVS
ncbi:MFS transporter, partial [Nocardia otitidiscaviarum]|nr:MFS transporter [Nocardia otitidiscaviarum]